MIILHETDTSVTKEESEKAYLEGIVKGDEKVSAKISLDSSTKPAWVRYLNDKVGDLVPYNGPVFYVKLQNGSERFAFRPVTEYNSDITLSKSSNEDMIYTFDRALVDGKELLPNTFVLLEPGEHCFRLLEPNKDGSSIYGPAPNGALILRFTDDISPGDIPFEFGRKEDEIMWAFQKLNTSSKKHVHKIRREWFYCMGGEFYYHFYKDGKQSILLNSENRTVHVPSNLPHNHETKDKPSWFNAVNVPILFNDNERLE